MTVGELYNQVSQLGFEDALENNDRFYFAANRAILQVNTLRPAVKALAIDHRPLPNEIKGSSFAPIERVSDLIFEADSAKAFYCEADGVGILYIETFDENAGAWRLLAVKQLSAKKKFTSYSGFIKEGGEFVASKIRLRFSGEFIYSVRNVALYKYLYSDEENDIPSYEAFTRYDMRQLTDDFLGFAEPPIVDNANQTRLNQGYEIEGGYILLLPHDNAGVYKVMYKRRPHEIINNGEATVDETIIDLDEELSHMLPNLVASYIWAEDEPSLAEYYLSLYRERAAEIRATAKNPAPARYTSVNGW